MKWKRDAETEAQDFWDRDAEPDLYRKRDAEPEAWGFDRKRDAFEELKP
jgi:hypothetical protein